MRRCPHVFQATLWIFLSAPIEITITHHVEHPEAMRGKLKTIASLAVGAGFFYWFVHLLNWGEVWREVQKADMVCLGLAVTLLVSTYLVRALRWRTLLLPMADPPLKSLLRATVIGFTALFVMGRAAEMLIRPSVLSIDKKVHPSASLATVMIERVFDMVMVVVFFSVNLAFFEYISSDGEAMKVFGWIRITGFVLLVASIAGIYGLSVFRRRSSSVLAYLDRKFKWLPRPLHEGFMSLLSHISEGLSVLHDAKSLTVTVTYTVVLWSLVALAHLLIIRAFGVSRSEVPLTGAVFVMGLSMLGSVVPTPGGATGPFHAATAAALIFLGVSQNKSASVAIILHLAIFAPATLFGMLYIIKDGLSLGRLSKIGAKQLDESLHGFPPHSSKEVPEGEKAAIARGIY